MMNNTKNIVNNKLDIDQDPIKEINTIPKNEKEDLTDYELNDLEYEEALEKDNRNFFKTYWYLLKREQIILYTFFN